MRSECNQSQPEFELRSPVSFFTPDNKYTICPFTVIKIDKNKIEYLEAFCPIHILFPNLNVEFTEVVDFLFFYKIKKKKKKSMIDYVSYRLDEITFISSRFMDQSALAGQANYL